MKKKPVELSVFESLDGLSLSERIDKLGQEILANAFVIMDNIRLYGKKASKREIEMQEDLQQQFKYVQSVYSALVKMNRISGAGGANNESFEKGLLDKIKETKSSIGNIVTQVPKTKNVLQEPQ